MLQRYHNIIMTQVESKFIEKVDDPLTHNKGHYLPHHAVKDYVTTLSKDSLQLY